MHENFYDDSHIHHYCYEHRSFHGHQRRQPHRYRPGLAGHGLEADQIDAEWPDSLRNLPDPLSAEAWEILDRDRCGYLLRELGIAKIDLMGRDAKRVDEGS